MRREVSPKIRKRAKLAASFLLMEGRGANERVVICQSTPQWVCDVVNRSADVNGVVDQWRQKFAFESLKMVRAGSPPSVATSDNLDDLRAWEGATDAKRRYVEKARTMLESPSETQLLQTAQRFERFEVYFQVYETLEDAPYDGSLYDIERVRRRKAAES